MSRGPYKQVERRGHKLRLRELRIERGLTQQDVADALEVEQGAVSKQEKGLSKIDTLTLEKYAALYDVAVGQLFQNGDGLNDEERDLIAYLRTHPRDKAVLLSTYRGLRDNARPSQYVGED
jgi:transcriptional regulator with XRE-family HTH domain